MTPERALPSDLKLRVREACAVIVSAVSLCVWLWSKKGSGSRPVAALLHKSPLERTMLPFSRHTLIFFIFLLQCGHFSPPPWFCCFKGQRGVSKQKRCWLPEWLICQVHASSSLLRGGPCSVSYQGGPCVTVQLVDLISIQLALHWAPETTAQALSSGSAPPALNLANGLQRESFRTNCRVCCRSALCDLMSQCPLGRISQG